LIDGNGGSHLYEGGHISYPDDDYNNKN